MLKPLFLTTKEERGKGDVRDCHFMNKEVGPGRTQNFPAEVVSGETGCRALPCRLHRWARAKREGHQRKDQRWSTNPSKCGHRPQKRTLPKPTP